MRVKVRERKRRTDRERNTHVESKRKETDRERQIDKEVTKDTKRAYIQIEVM